MKIFTLFILGILMTALVSCSLVDSSSVIPVSSSSSLPWDGSEPLMEFSDAPVSLAANVSNLALFAISNFDYADRGADTNVYNLFYSAWPDAIALTAALEALLLERRPVYHTFTEIDSLTPWYQKTVYSTGTIDYTNEQGHLKTVWTNGTTRISNSGRYYYQYSSGQFMVTNLANGARISYYPPGLIVCAHPSGYYYQKWTNSDGTDYYRMDLTNGCRIYQYRGQDVRGYYPFGEISYYRSTGTRYLHFTNTLTNYLYDDPARALTMVQPGPRTNYFYPGGTKTVMVTNIKTTYYTNGNIYLYYPDGGLTRTTRNGGVVNYLDASGVITNTRMTAAWAHSDGFLETANFIVGYTAVNSNAVAALINGVSNIENAVYAPVHAFYDNYSRAAKCVLVFFDNSNGFMQEFGSTNWMPGGFNSGDNFIGMSPLFTNNTVLSTLRGLRHEFSHNEFTHILRGGSVPAWLNEGTAQLVETLGDTNDSETVKADLNSYSNMLSGTLLDWTHIATNSFGRLERPTALKAYDQSLSYVNWLYILYGKGQLYDFIRSFTNGSLYQSDDYAAAFNIIYGGPFTTSLDSWKLTLP